MRKLFCFLLLFIILINTIGCSQSYWNNHSKVDIPRKLRFEYFYSKHFGTNTTATATQIIDGTGKNVTISFYSPERLYIDRFKEHPTLNDTFEDIPTLRDSLLDVNVPRYCYRIAVLDVEVYTTQQSVRNPWKWPATSYHVQVLKNESTGEEINQDAYIFEDGSPQYVQYGYSRLAVGQEYLLIDAYAPLMTGWRELQDDYVYSPVYLCMFEIHTIDDVEYLYPCRCDISSLDFKIEITDPLENQMYKDYKDWDIIEYINKNNIENPTFNYKLILDEFVEYRDQYNTEWNSKYDSEPTLDMIKEYAKYRSMGIPAEDRIYVNKRSSE